MRKRKKEIAIRKATKEEKTMQKGNTNNLIEIDNIHVNINFLKYCYVIKCEDDIFKIILKFSDGEEVTSITEYSTRKEAKQKIKQYKNDI